MWVGKVVGKKFKAALKRNALNNSLSELAECAVVILPKPTHITSSTAASGFSLSSRAYRNIPSCLSVLSYEIDFCVPSDLHNNGRLMSRYSAGYKHKCFAPVSFRDPHDC